MDAATAEVAEALVVCGMALCLCLLEPIPSRLAVVAREMQGIGAATVRTPFFPVLHPLAAVAGALQISRQLMPTLRLVAQAVAVVRLELHLAQAVLGRQVKATLVGLVSLMTTTTAKAAAVVDEVQLVQMAHLAGRVLVALEPIVIQRGRPQQAQAQVGTTLAGAVAVATRIPLAQLVDWGEAAQVAGKQIPALEFRELPTLAAAAAAGARTSTKQAPMAAPGL